MANIRTIRAHGARYGCYVLALIALSTVQTGLADDTRSLTVDDILGALATTHERRDCFVETRRSAILTEPLVSRGTLVFRSPGFIEKHTRTPVEEYFAGDGDQLTLRDARTAQPKTLKLASHPPLQGMVAAFRASLAGDSTTLHKFFETGISGNAAAWRILLKPRADALRKLIESIELAGSGGTLQRFTVQERSGDVSVTEIVPCGPEPRR